MIKTFFGIWNETRLDLNTERFRTAIWYCNSATKVSLLPECLRTILRNKWNHNGIEIVAKGYIKLQTLNFFFRHPNSLLAINHTMIFIIWLIVVHCKFRYFLLQLKFYCRLIKYCFYQSELHLLVLSRSQRITRKTMFLHWITSYEVLFSSLYPKTIYMVFHNDTGFWGRKLSQNICLGS